jgi:hypothetical protein
MTQTYLNGQATTVPGASRAASAARAASFKRANRPYGFRRKPDRALVRFDLPGTLADCGRNFTFECPLIS